MSDSSTFGFGKFIPGFDFLQNIGKANAPASGLPPFAHWVAPTVSVEEIDKRIEELRSVLFWLEQNSKALAATVQALEVQKMTLTTLQGMNVNLQEMAQAFQATSASASWPMPTDKPAPAPAPAAAPQATEKPAVTEAATEAPAAAPEAAQTAHMAAAMQWWSALTQQFQQIAQHAMHDTAQQQAVIKATQMSTELAQKAMTTANAMVRQAVTPQQAAAAPAPPTKPKAASKSAPTKASRAAPVKKAASADKKAVSKAAKKAGGAAKKAAGKTPSR